MIRLENIHKTFNAGQVNEVQALRGVSLDIEEKQFAVIIGANGSGKSSLLNLIAGGFKPDKGNIYLDGQEVSRLPDHKRSSWVARIFQDPLKGTAPDLSVLDNFRLAALRTKRKGLKIGINAKFRQAVQDKIALLEMNLEDKLEQKMGSLSGGQRQALSLIMAIMDDSSILLLDEPTAALDPRSAKIIMQKAAKIIADFELTAVLVTHDLRDAQTYGNRLLQMQEGCLLRDLNAEAKSQLELNDIFAWF